MVTFSPYSSMEGDILHLQAERTAEAGERRELSLIVVLTSLAGGEGGGRRDLFCDGRLEGRSSRGCSAARSNSSCWYIISVLKPPSSFKSSPECRAIILGRPCRVSVVRPI